jgi:hypothetical protein
MPNNIYNDKFEEKKRKLSYFIATHRVMFRRIFIGIASLVAGALVLWGVISLLNAYVFNYGSDRDAQQAIVTDKIDYQEVSEASSPAPLQKNDVKLFYDSSRDGSTDFVAEVFNPNTTWMVESFEYYFTYGPNKTPRKVDFVLPTQTKFVLELNYELESKFTNADIIIENVKWKKVSNFAELEDKFMQFKVKNVKLQSSKQTKISGEVDFSTIAFDVYNEGTYNFWDPKFVILVYSNKRLVAASQYVMDDISAGEKVSSKVIIPEKFQINSSVLIVPDINILDSDVFKGYDVGSGELK